MKLSLTKMPNHSLVASDATTDEYLRSKVRIGEVVRGEFRKARNYAFHKKMFALLNLAYEYWETPETDTKWGKPEKNFDVFRKNVTILAGYGHPVFNIDGSFKMQADSISFASMDNDTFEDLYNKVLDVIIQRIPVLCDMSKDEINALVERFLEFS